MRIESSALGLQAGDPERQIVFPLGLSGFESSTTYQLFHESEADLVGYLQAVDDPEVTFSVVPPESINIFFEFTLSDEEQALLELESPEDAMLLLIVYKSQPESGEGSAKASRVNASFMAPLVINFKKRLGLQKILQNTQRRITIKAE
ncbi:MAG: flagellar assembly protein FliW [Sedimenticola sp.]|nr:flagellar assembly protein FliW [Sedimenticola sp.]